MRNDIPSGISTPEKMAEEAVFYTKNKGHRIIKVKAGVNPDFDTTALKLIRNAVGDSIRIRVDANQGVYLKLRKRSDRKDVSPEN